MTLSKETIEKLGPEHVGSSTMSLISAAFGSPEWYKGIFNLGLIYAVSVTGDQTLKTLTIPCEKSYRPIPYEVTDLVLEVFQEDSGLIEELRRWQEESQQRAVQQFIQREAEKVDCILIVDATYRPDTIDLLFVVDGDLFDGESAVLPIVTRLYDNFPDIPFDFMVLPAARYDKEFTWGTHSEALFSRQR